MDRIVPIPHPITTLLRAKDVRQELRISAALFNELERSIEEVELPLWRLRDLPIQERNDAAGLLIQPLRKNLERLLSRQQIERLNQLIRQAEGIPVILESEMLLKLGLSKEQIGHIHMALNNSYNKLLTVQRNTESLSESQRAGSIRTVHDETEKSIIAVLNGYQQRALRKLMGEPFDLSNVRIVACKAPEFDVDTWIHPPGSNRPELAGKVTVIHFYTFGCENCIRTLPYYTEWRAHFPTSVFQVIGIHRPETEQEREIDKVKENAVEAGMEYPIAIDTDGLMWDAWANRVWPSIYLLDKNGYVRYWWYGELNWQGAESEKYLRDKIQELIDEKA
ncbi:MAG: redoxin domain-containing protein [Sedimentisphaerales bacterium]|nr:redoxin domain-containing protein [Sedimentisphaerales bacterium]